MEPKIHTWEIELLNAYCDDLPLQIPLLDAVEIAKEREREEANETILSAKLVDII